ncbi:hypothetical protein ACIQF6_02560 [Kitasatospora sp. NPDC092948]|uniref:hypothetical protein n=1 Tax=Kitasatospora sp. NPDC092948 TaxID=3364088 RepID=UPI0038066062
MTSEEDFARALRASAAHAPEPSTELFALAAERRGRTRALRRRAAGASALALVAAAGCALALLPDRPAATPGPGGAPSAQQTLSEADTLRSLMPTGGTITEVVLSPPDSRGTPVGTALNYDDGNGPVEVWLAFDRMATPLSDAAIALQCPDALAQPTSTCRTATRPDGSHVVTTVTTPRWDNDDRSWTVTYTTPDGRWIRASELATGSATRPAREHPALTEAQLLDVVTSDAWQPSLDIIPAPTVPPATPVTGPAVIATLRAALPDGASLDTGTDPQATPGRAHGAVSFGGRTSQLVVSVEHGWRRGYAVDPVSTFNNFAYGAASGQAPDGTRFYAREVQGADPRRTDPAPGNEWIVSALHPDGTMVTVTLWTYGPGYRFAAGPGALDQEQLVALATAASWEHA